MFIYFGLHRWDLITCACVRACVQNIGRACVLDACVCRACVVRVRIVRACGIRFGSVRYYVLNGLIRWQSIT